MKIFATVMDGAKATLFSPIKLVKNNKAVFILFALAMLVYSMIPVDFENDQSIKYYGKEKVLFVFAVMLVYGIYAVNLGIHLMREYVLGSSQRKPEDYINKWFVWLLGNFGILLITVLPLIVAVLIALKTPLVSYKAGVISVLAVGLLATIYVSTRICLYMPARISDVSTGLIITWKSTRGYVWKVFCINLLTAVIATIIYFAESLLTMAYLVNFVPDLENYTPSTSERVVFTIIENIIYLYVSSFYFVVMAITYRNITNEKKAQLKRKHASNLL